MCHKSLNPCNGFYLSRVFQITIHYKAIKIEKTIQHKIIITCIKDYGKRLPALGVTKNVYWNNSKCKRQQFKNKKHILNISFNYLNSSTTTNEEEYREARTKVKRIVNQKYKQSWDRFASDINMMCIAGKEWFTKMLKTEHK